MPTKYHAKYFAYELTRGKNHFYKKINIKAVSKCFPLSAGSKVKEDDGGKQKGKF
jgi:hypothetical protein